jgi:hypothetical protein
MGRPREKLKRTSVLFTNRFRRLIDIAHDGNIREASRATGLPYPTLRDLYSGRNANPSLNTLRALADTYKVYEQWFLDEKQGDQIPLGGWVAYLPAFDGSIERRKIRETIIPFAAWSMKSVAERLDSVLEAVPPTPKRPIVGDSRDEKEFNLKLSTFLFQSILDAERAIGRELAPNYAVAPYPEMDDQWISRLKLLGLYWESIVDELIESIHASQ